MLLKLLTLIGVLLTLYGLAQRAAGLFGGSPPRTARATDMQRCGTCGAWHEGSQPCRCAVPPTP